MLKLPLYLRSLSMPEKKGKLIFIAVLTCFLEVIQSCNEPAKVSGNNDEDSLSVADVYDFEKVDKYGYLLGNGCDFYGDNFNPLGHFVPKDSLILVRITGISKDMFNLNGSDDKCLKAHFVNIELDGKSYIVFGSDVYVKQAEQLKRIRNSKNEEWIVFPIKALQMGASDEEGLTMCDEYSYLVMQYNRTGRTTLLQYPKNDSLRLQSNLKYGVLYNDDMSEDIISELDIKNDSVYIHIQSTGQEGGHIFTIKTQAYSNLPYTEIVDFKRFETDELFQQYIQESSKASN